MRNPFSVLISLRFIRNLRRTCNVTIWTFCTWFPLCLFGITEVGADRLFSEEYRGVLQGATVGIITNHTGINSRGESTLQQLKKHQQEYDYRLKAIFAPEHGLNGVQYASEKVHDDKDPEGIPIYSLHGSSRRPLPKMLQGLSLVIYDIQDLGCRSYTYSSTLFYAMEELKKADIPLIVLDRPNPLGGLLIDGPMLEEKWRSFVGYLNVPYCHAMTIGELAQFFNGEYKIGCNLTVIPMKGWKREQTYSETGLPWIPPSPQIPDAATAFYYPTTGILGELQVVNIGVGYTLPFRVVGAPWIDAENFAKTLNSHHYPGVLFHPFHYRPFFGRFAHQTCHGVLLIITNHAQFLPVTTQYLLMATLKALYPEEFNQALSGATKRWEMFHRVCGTDAVLRTVQTTTHCLWPLREIHHKEKERYRQTRKPYLLYTVY